MSPRRTDKERATIERQAVAQSKIREAIATYLVAYDIAQDVAYEVVTESHETLGNGFMDEVFNHLDDLIDDISELPTTAGIGEVVKVGGNE